MSERSLQDVLDRYPDPLTMLRERNLVAAPTPEGRPRELEYTNWLDEQLSWKETCYIGDWSFMPDLRVAGPQALDLFRDLTVNSVEDFPIGKAKHAVQCNEDGKIIGDGILLRYDEDQYHTQHLAAWPMFNAEKFDYEVEAEIHDTFIYQVQGPTSQALLEAVTDAELSDIAFMHFGEIEIAGADVIALRQGMSGEVGFELQGDMADADRVWNSIVEAGEEFGLRRLGHRTHMLNHVEMAFSTRGHHYLPAIFGEDMREYREFLDAENAAEAHFTITGSYDADDVSAYYRSPVDLNWERNINFDHDFVGKEALTQELTNPTTETVTLVWDEEDVLDVFATFFRTGDHHKWMEIPYQNYRAIEGDAVRTNGSVVGMSTGRGYSYYFRDMISLCTIDSEHAAPGTRVRIEWGEGATDNPKIRDHQPVEIGATVAPAPFKEDRRRSSPTPTTVEGQRPQHD